MTDYFWVRPQPRASASMRLLCFPHAGGSAAMFRSWLKPMGEQVEVCSAELPGRGARYGHAPFVTFDTLVGGVLDAIFPLLDRPFALFGHSMGALIAFETARRLASLSAPAPLHLFVSGEPAPEFRKPSHLGSLTEEGLLQELLRLDGTPRAVLEDPGMRQYFLPILRADYRVLDSYVYRPGSPLSCPVTAFAGKTDKDLTPESIRAWGAETTGYFREQWLDCGHFYTPDSEQRVISEIVRSLANAG